MSVEFLLVLLFLLLLLAGVTVAGHFMWLIAAAFFRALNDAPPERRRPTRNEREEQFRDLLAFRRVLGNFRDRGWISPDVAQQLFQLCRRAEEELSAEPSRKLVAPPVQAAPVQAAPVQAAPVQAAPVQEAPVHAAPIPANPSIPATVTPAAASPGTELAAAAKLASQNPKPVGEREWVVARMAEHSMEPIAARVAPSAEPVRQSRPTFAAPPRRALSEVLQSFLAAHNIRWGELVAGILIVVCSIGLVISLWSTLTATHRLLPAAVFLLAAAGIEGAGLYTLRRWRLRHTSRVVLVIGTMLIPLSMMAGISVAGSGDAAVSLTAPSTWAAIAGGWLICGGLIFYGGRALVRRPADRLWTLAIGLPTVLLPLVPALTRYFEDSAAWLLLVASSAVATAIVFDARQVKRKGRDALSCEAAGRSRTKGLADQLRPLGPGAVRRRFLLAGIGVYALAVLTAMCVLRLGTEREVLLSLGLSWLPVFAALAATAVSIRDAATAATPRVVAVAVAAVAGVATLALFPPTLASFAWSGLYTSLVVVSAFAAGWRLRTAAVVAAAPIALGMFAPLASVHWLGGVAWDDAMPLWRRYVSGESMLSLFTVAALLLPITRSRLVIERWGTEGRQLLAGVAVGFAAAALGIGLVIGLGPEAWLGILPRFVVVGLIAITALALTVTQPPRQRTVNLVTFAVLAAWGTALVPMDVWFRQPMAAWLPALTAAVLGSAASVGLLGEIGRFDWGKFVSALARNAPGRKVLACWWDQAAALALVAAVLAAVEFAYDRRVGMLAAAAASAVLLVAAFRSRKSRWLSAGQFASFFAVGFAAVWLRPAWFLPLSAWMTTDALFASVAVAGGFAALWAGLRMLAALGPRSLAQRFERDRIFVDAHLARLVVAGWLLGFAAVMFRLFGGYARSMSPLLPSVTFLVAAMIATGMAVGAWWWLSVRVAESPNAERARAERRRGMRSHDTLSASEWSLSATITLLTAASMLTILACGSGAAGVAGVGWSAIVLATICSMAAWWLGRRSADETRGDLLNQLRTVSVISLLTLSGATVSLILGLGDANFFSSSPAGLHRWTIGTLAAWGMGGTIVLAILSRLLHSPSAAYLAALLAPATAALAWRWFDGAATGHEWLAVAVATTMVSYLIVRLLDQVGATARLDAVAWPRTGSGFGSGSGAQLGLGPQHQPLWQVAVGGITVALLAAAIVIGMVWIRELPSHRSVLLWGGTYLLAVGLVFGRSKRFHASRDDAGLALVVLGSGLATALCVTSGWLPADRGWVGITTIWVLATAGFGALGIIRVRPLSVGISLALSAAVAVAAASHVATSRVSLWLWLAATVLASGLAVASYVRFPWRVAGQWIAAAAAVSGLWLLVWWVPGEYLVAASALVMASLTLLWRTVSRLSPPITSCFAAVALFAASFLLLLVFGEAYGRGVRLGEWSAMIGIVSLAMLIVTTPLGIARRGSLAIAYAATQLLIAIGVGSLWRDGIPASPLAVAVVGCMLVTGLWVWGWPLRRHLLRPSHHGIIDWNEAIDRRATREFVAMLLISTATAGAIASLAVVGGTDANSRWLMIGSLAGYGWLLAIASGWFEPLAASTEFAEPREHLGGGSQLRVVSVLVFTAALMLAAAGLDPETRPWGLIVVMRMLVAGVILVPMTVWGAPRLLRLNTDRWGIALRVGAIVGGIVAASSLGLMLVLEWQLRGSVQAAAIPLPLVIGIAILLAVWSATMAALGIRPRSAGGVLPELSDTDRRWLLRAAQAIGGIAWLHVFLCRPDLALVGLRPYWPYLVLALAFLSAGIAEWGRRRGDAVVGDTMRQTTLYLPLIPAIGFWLSAGRSEWMFGGGAVPYAWLLLLAAVLYGGLAVMWRRDMFPRVASIVLANLALWVVLAQTPSFDFVTHPQLWLIPPAVCVLFAAHLERRRLDPKVLAAIRYSATLVIYISSTADVLLGEIGEGLYGPIILILLALAGMAAGAVLRTRAFLYLGTLFVVVGVLSMVWHAQQAIDQVWPWWVFGITTGVLLLVGLMAIEKNKPKIRHWADAMAAWDS